MNKKEIERDFEVMLKKIKDLVMEKKDEENVIGKLIDSEVEDECIKKKFVKIWKEKIKCDNERKEM